MEEQRANRPLRIPAVGGTGSIGRRVVEQSLQAGHVVRVLARNPEGHRFPSSVELFKGDLTRPETLRTALKDVDAIVFTHGTCGDPKAVQAVDCGGVRNDEHAIDGVFDTASMPVEGEAA